MYAIFLHTRRYCKQSILFKIFKIIIDQSNFTFSPYLFRTKNRPIQEHTSPDRPQSRAPPTRLPAWRYWGGFSPPKLGILEKKIPKMGMRFPFFRVLSKKEGEFSENRTMMVERIKRHQTPKNIRKREDHVKQDEKNRQPTPNNMKQRQ